MDILSQENTNLSKRLKDIRMFQNLSEGELLALTEISELVQYYDQETIVTQNTNSSNLFVILEGRIDITVSGHEKTDIFLSHVRAGDVFGEASLFMDVKRTATARADGIAVLVTISREKFLNYANQNPIAGLKIFSFIIYSLLNKLAIANKDLALERESSVSQEDLDELKKLFPYNLSDMN